MGMVIPPSSPPKQIMECVSQHQGSLIYNNAGKPCRVRYLVLTFPAVLMSTTAPKIRSGISSAWFMFIVLSVIYLGFLTKNYYWDGIAFAQAIEGAPKIHVSLVHPNHLIYNLVGYVFYRAAQALGFNPRAVTVLQILNALLGAATCGLLFHILKNILRSAYIAITLSLLFAFSATWWKYTVDADAYIPSILFLLLSFYLVLPGRKSNPVLVALIYSLALCLHQMAIISFPCSWSPCGFKMNTHARDDLSTV